MERGPTEEPPQDNGADKLDSKIEQNLDNFIKKWGSDLRDEWTDAGRLGPNDYKQMSRTALITICRVREARAAARKAHAFNAICGHVAPDMRGKKISELLVIAQPTTKDFEKFP